MASTRFRFLGGTVAVAAAIGVSAGVADMGVSTVHGDSTAEEQVMLERLNAARKDPRAAQTRLKVDLSARGRFALAPKPPLAMNSLLTEAARGHSRNMSDRGFFSHTDHLGRRPADRIRSAGDQFKACSENLAVSDPLPEQALDRLLIDEGVADLAHRVSLLGLSEQANMFDEVGIAAIKTNGKWKYYYTVDLATDADPNPYLLGVVYRDTNSNGLYDAGEGLPGIKVQVGATEDKSVTATVGGYAILISDPGTYTVTFSGAGLPEPVQLPLEIRDKNVKIDVKVGGAPASKSVP